MRTTVAMRILDERVRDCLPAWRIDPMVFVHGQHDSTVVVRGTALDRPPEGFGDGVPALHR